MGEAVCGDLTDTTEVESNVDVEVRVTFLNYDGF
jgi:hypothetical protein